MPMKKNKHIEEAQNKSDYSRYVIAGQQQWQQPVTKAGRSGASMPYVPAEMKRISKVGKSFTLLILTICSSFVSFNDKQL